MAISFVGLAAAATNTVALPTFAAGDLGLTFAFRDGSNTPPDLPAGWTNILTDPDPISCSERTGYRVLQTGDTDTGIWTNATELQVMVLRGANVTTPIAGFGADTTNNSNLPDYFAPFRGTNLVSTTSWIVGMAAHRNATDVNLGTITGAEPMTIRSGSVGTLGAHTRTGAATFLGEPYDSAVNSASGAWASITLEVVDASITLATGAWFRA